MRVIPRNCYSCKKYKPCDEQRGRNMAEVRVYGLCHETPGALPYPVYAPWGCCESYTAKEEATVNAP